MQKILLSSLILPFIGLFSFSGCAYKTDADLNPVFVCDTTNMNFVKIQAILENNACMTCHSTSTANVSGGGYHLDNYENVKAFSIDSLLYKSVTHDPSVQPMPRNLPKISDCDISKISRWMQNNFPQ